MRETIADWKKDWIDANGLTNELEVIIKDSHRIKSDTCLLYTSSSGSGGRREDGADR